MDYTMRTEYNPQSTKDSHPCTRLKVTDSLASMLLSNESFRRNYPRAMFAVKVAVLCVAIYLRVR